MVAMGEHSGLNRTLMRCAQNLPRERMSGPFAFAMATAQAAQAAQVSAAEAAPAPARVLDPPSRQLRQSARLAEIRAAGKEVVYNTPSTRKKRNPNQQFHIYEVYDRDAADPEWYWVKWHNYKAERFDTAQHRDRLVEDQCGFLCDYVDRFKEWQAEKPEENRTFSAFKKSHPNQRVFAADTNGRCYVASLQCAAALLGLGDYVTDHVLAMFFEAHPDVESKGVTWQRLTQLMQLANVEKKKAGGVGICFKGKRSQTNLVRKTMSEFGSLVVDPGVYLCGVVTAVAGHMFVLHATAEGLWVHDSMELGRAPFASVDYSWVLKWKFIKQVFPGHF